MNGFGTKIEKNGGLFIENYPNFGIYYGFIKIFIGLEIRL